MQLTDLDDAYTNSAYIPNGSEYAGKWAAEAATFRDALLPRVSDALDVAYGPGERQRYDLFIPATEPKGLFIFVHGGYWMRFAKSDWSHLARGALARSHAVALPGYTLAPEISVTEIGRQVASAICQIAETIDGPISLAGHSAGGHLVTRMVCDDNLLPLEVISRIREVISISGVHDLRPLLHTEMNKTLKLTDAEATRESPALLRPVPGMRVHCWVGSDERPEFLRQNDLLANVWFGLGADIVSTHAAAKHHFNVIEELTDPDSKLCCLVAP